MAQSAQIQKMSHRHEALLQYMIAHPEARARELAIIFEMTPAWISTIIHSHAFQAQLAARQDECFSETVLPLREKMLGLAHDAVEKLGTQLDNSQDPKYVLDVADKVLHRLGYAPKARESAPPAGSTIHNTLNVYQTDKDTLMQARALMFTRQESLSAPPVELPEPALIDAACGADSREGIGDEQAAPEGADS